MKDNDLAIYNQMSDMGVIKQIETLRKAIKEKDDLLYDAVQVFEKHTIEDLILYVTSKLLDKFIPLYLIFFIQDYYIAEKVNAICYKNLTEDESPVKIDSLFPYKKVFDLFPSSISFSAFANLMDSKEFTDPLKIINPELIVPMMGKEGAYGFIVVSEKALGEKYTEKELTYINMLMKFTSISLQNIMNYSRAVRDMKTKLYNHSFFIRRFDEELSRIKRYKTNVSVMMIDVDHFKLFNDSYGHVAGDILLEEIASVLRKTVRNEDVVARFGGEEFIVMLVECTHEVSFDIANRIREEIARIKIPYKDQLLSVTASIGLMNINQNNLSESAQLIRKADIALYHSKESGRNRCTLYTEQLESCDNS